MLHSCFAFFVLSFLFTFYLCNHICLDLTFSSKPLPPIHRFPESFAMRNNLPCIRHVFIAASMVILLTACPSERKPEPELQRGRIIEPTHRVLILEEYHDRLSDPDLADKAVAHVRVAIADTERERNLGLMNVYDLPDDAGMYFVFEEEAPRSFWMVNTPLPLDILFMDRDHRIVRIRPHTNPFSSRQILSDYPAQYVLEVNAGFTAEHDIREGMFVVLR